MSVTYANNIVHLQKYYQNIYKALQQDQSQENNIQMEKTRSNDITAIYQSNEDQRPVYIHSRNNPVEEARRWVSNQLNDKCQHVIFYGFGCGYMVQALLDIKPKIKISVYEPSLEIFKYTVNHCEISKLLSPKNIEVFGLETSNKAMEEFINIVVPNINSETQVLILPSYNRMFPDKADQFKKIFVKVTENYKSSLGMNARAETWWTLNSLLNFKAIVDTPSIFSKQDQFKNKPLIIVSAGPSLEYEFENLKYIYDNSMAYIFAVGSAVHGLIANNIIPHAFCSYDPWPANEKVFSNLKRTDFPLIFGSSIFNNTLRHHQGPKFHMIISQDTFSPYILGINKSEIINDAPSIAVCTLQLAYKLGCNPIVLVGQDLAFPREKFYANGINFNRSEEISEQEKNDAIKVTSVGGGMVLTRKKFDRTRQNMEYYLRTYTDREIINTSPEGARIVGTTEQRLSSVIDEMFVGNTANPNWYEGTYGHTYANNNILNMVNKIKGSLQELDITVRNMSYYIKSINDSRYIKYRVENDYKKLENEINKLQSNDYYKIIISPMVRAEQEVLKKLLPKINNEKNVINKSDLIVKCYLNLLNKINHSIDITKQIICQI
ncbi:6-hydroxymethylpterin diphosphokinase MptE-like protein [Peptococcaceae bacterium 1198_IL3148]